MEELQVGQPAPDFVLPGTGGHDYRLSGYHGKRIVLYFYSKDNTAG